LEAIGTPLIGLTTTDNKTVAAMKIIGSVTSVIPENWGEKHPLCVLAKLDGFPANSSCTFYDLIYIASPLELSPLVQTCKDRGEMSYSGCKAILMGQTSEFDPAYDSLPEKFVGEKPYFFCVAAMQGDPNFQALPPTEQSLAVQSCSFYTFLGFDPAFAAVIPLVDMCLAAGISTIQDCEAMLPAILLKATHGLNPDTTTLYSDLNEKCEEGQTGIANILSSGSKSQMSVILFAIGCAGAILSLVVDVGKPLCIFSALIVLVAAIMTLLALLSFSNISGDGGDGAGNSVPQIGDKLVSQGPGAMWFIVALALGVLSSILLTVAAVKGESAEVLPK